MSGVLPCINAINIHVRRSQYCPNGISITPPRGAQQSISFRAASSSLGSTASCDYKQQRNYDYYRFDALHTAPLTIRAAR
jgi:hypothetical protein